MEFRRIRYFATIVEEGNISLAAKKLNMAQPPLSQQLKLLEEELNMKLLERNTRNLTLTEEGKVFYEKSLEILEVVERTKQRMKEISEGISGTLNIGMIPSLGAELLPEKIKDFYHRYPKVKFQIWEGDPNRIMELLEKRVIEIGIVRLPIDYELFEAISFPEEPFVAVMSKSMEINQESQSINLVELKDKPLMLLRRHKGTSSYTESIYVGDTLKKACANLGFEPNIMCESSDLMTLLTWASYDIGIAIIPKSAEKTIPNSSLLFKQITNPVVMARPPAVIWLKGRYLSTVAKLFKQYFEH
ncbi:LysR family transcriptional regulator [Lysinibacillus yapensis]|nr:LysR family transcriptional regulator [Lysinibacillus yapensis]